MAVLYHNVKGEFFDDADIRRRTGGEHPLRLLGRGLRRPRQRRLARHLSSHGTVYPEVEKVFPEYNYKTQRVVYRNLGNGTFEEVSDLCGAAVLEPHSSRGCAFGDFNNDGNMDMLIMNMSEPPTLLKNENRSGNHWLSVKAVGTSQTVPPSGRAWL